MLIEQGRLCSDCADAQSDPSLRYSQMSPVHLLIVQLKVINYFDLGRNNNLTLLANISDKTMTLPRLKILRMIFTFSISF